MSLLPLGLLRRFWIVLLALSPQLLVVLRAQFGYAINNGTVTITGYDQSDRIVHIPDTIEGLPVTSIGDQAFYWSLNVDEITIPETVTRIGNGAFGECVSLRTINLPNGLISIGHSAFASCVSLSSVTIPAGIGTLEDQTFSYCGSLTNLVLSERLTSIGVATFYYCTNLTELTIPEGVTNIGRLAFSYCTSLKNVMIPRTVSFIGEEAFSACVSLPSIALPSQLTQIAPRTFDGCHTLTNLVIPRGVVVIGEYAFRNCPSLLGVYFEGNAPLVDWSIWPPGAEGWKVYYLPGTSGWLDSWGGYWTAHWFLPFPVILNHDSRFGVQTNGFSFAISWATNANVTVDASATLIDPVWSQVATAPMVNGVASFTDPDWTNHLARFYRVRQQ